MHRSLRATRAFSVHIAARFLAAAVTLALAVAAAPASGGAAADSVTVLRTNWTSRVITNVVEVRVPTNIFVTEYRTNSFTVVRTNVVNVFQTNDGSILLFGRDATFKHDLPPGRYQVEWTAHVAGKSAPLRLRATLEVTADAVHRRGLAAIVAAQ